MVSSILLSSPVYRHFSRPRHEAFGLRVSVFGFLSDFDIRFVLFKSHPKWR